MALFHTSLYHPWMLYKTLQVGYCLWTATSEAAISFSWVPCTFPLEWLFSEWVGSSLKSLFKKVWVISDPQHFTRHQRKFTRDTRPAPFRFSRYFLASLSSLFLPRHQHLPDVAGQPGLIPTDTLSSSFVLGTDTDRQTDTFVIICSDFQEALSLLVYRNLWYMDSQVCFLKVLFKTWIDHFFQINTEISSDGRLKILITFRFNNLFDASRVASIFRLI